MDLVMSVLTWVWNFYLCFCFVFTTFFMVKFYAGINSGIDKDRRETAIALVKIVKLVTIEIVNDRWIMYDTLTDRFICQAATEDELWALAKELFPSKELLLK
jgi:hypothetical protein